MKLLHHFYSTNRVRPSGVLRGGGAIHLTLCDYILHFPQSEFLYVAVKAKANSRGEQKRKVF